MSLINIVGTVSRYGETSRVLNWTVFKYTFGYVISENVIIMIVRSWNRTVYKSNKTRKILQYGTKGT